MFGKAYVGMLMIVVDIFERANAENTSAKENNQVLSLFSPLFFASKGHGKLSLIEVFMYGEKRG